MLLEITVLHYRLHSTLLFKNIEYRKLNKKEMIITNDKKEKRFASRVWPQSNDFEIQGIN